MIDDRAIYERVLKGLEDFERVEVKCPQETFENEARDFARHNLLDFYNHPEFKKKYRVEDNHSVTNGKV